MPGPEFFRRLGLFVVPNFIGLEFGAELCRTMASAPAEKGTVTGPNGEVILNQYARRVDESLVSEEMESPLKQLLCGLIPAIQSHFGVHIASLQGPQYLMYGPGDFFTVHRDSGSADVVRQRVISAVLFLNRESPEPGEDVYGGGQLTFYGLMNEPQWEKCGFDLRAEAGMLIAFPSGTPHEVKPVSHGRRFTIVSWFLGPEETAAAENGRI